MLSHDYRRIVGWISEVFGLPDFLASGFLQRYQSSIGTSRCADQLVTINQHGFRVSPERHFATEILQADFPNDFTGRCFCANDGSITSHCIDKVSINRGCATGAIAPSVFKNSLCHHRPPANIPGCCIQTNQSFVILVSPHRVDILVNNGEPRVSDTTFFGQPNQLGTLFRPRLQKPGFLRNIRAIGPSPSRPILSLCTSVANIKNEQTQPSGSQEHVSLSSTGTWRNSLIQLRPARVTYDANLKFLPQ